MGYSPNWEKGKHPAKCPTCSAWSIKQQASNSTAPTEPGSAYRGACKALWLAAVVPAGLLYAVIATVVWGDPLAAVGALGLLMRRRRRA